MNKVVDYFHDKKLYPRISFPQLTPAENVEVLRSLGVPEEHRGANINAEEVIRGTLTKMMHHSAPPSLFIPEMSNHCESSNTEEICTVRIRRGSEEAIGTVMIRPDDEYGTIKILGTVKINNGNPEIERDCLPEWTNNCGNIRVSRDDIKNGKLNSSQSQNNDFNFLLSKAPEQWEVNILSLENGEWNDGMNKGAFGKYKKERPALKGLFSDTSSSSKKLNTRKSNTDRPNHIKIKTKISDLPPGKKKLKSGGLLQTRKSSSIQERRVLINNAKVSKDTKKGIKFIEEK